MADDPTWERVLLMMPRHDCGLRMQPGGNESTGPLLVCAPCSYVTAVDPAWVDAVVAEATDGGSDG